MIRRALLGALLLLVSVVGTADARFTLYFTASAAMPAGPGARVSLDYLPIYGPADRSWGFGTVIPSGWCYYITDVYYSAKSIAVSGSRRSSGLVLDGLVTVYDYQSHYRPNTPLIAPPGFKVTGSFTNNTAEQQNMLAIVSGYLEPATPTGGCPEP